MTAANAVAIGSLVGLVLLFATVPPIAWAVCIVLSAIVGLSGSGTRG